MRVYATLKSKYLFEGLLIHNPGIPKASIILLSLLNVNVAGLGSTAFSIFVYQATSVFLNVERAFPKKRKMKMLTTSREVTPPDIVL